MRRARSIARASAIAGALVTMVMTAVAGSAGAASVTLVWTAPGGDGRVGRATAYDMRCSASPITPTSFLQATAVPGLPAPSPAGMRDSVTISGLTPGVEYWFVMRTRDQYYNWSALSNEVVIPIPVGVETIVRALDFGPPAPNPARASTSFEFALPAGGPLRVTVFDAGGRRVRELASGPQPPGAGRLVWDLADAAGRPVPAGWYAVRAELPGRTLVRRVVVTR